MKNKINFYTEKNQGKIRRTKLISRWIRSIAGFYEKDLIQINFIFCSDQYLLKKNIRYLNHDTLTDVITFDYSEKESKLEGDIFISVETVRKNAEEFNNFFMTELYTVMVHGVLHLVGFNDKNDYERQNMRKLEKKWLKIFASMKEFYL
jgi:probable rRNA maturation factor